MIFRSPRIDLQISLTVHLDCLRVTSYSYLTREGLPTITNKSARMRHLIKNAGANPLNRLPCWAYFLTSRHLKDTCAASPSGNVTFQK
jgi:hypothetical protein